MFVKFVVRYFFDKLPKHRGRVTKQRGVVSREKRKKCVCAADSPPPQVFLMRQKKGEKRNESQKHAIYPF